jgi:hypothetical protein
VFYALLLEPFNLKGLIPHLDILIMDTLRAFGDDVWDVERIIDRKRDETGQWLYYVKWAGFPDKENLWELGVNISSNTLKQFWEKAEILLKRLQALKAAKRQLGRLPKERGDSQAT